MKLLLTGREGQVGWELERALQPFGEVIAFDRASLDLADTARVRQAVLDHRPDWVINAAAYTQVDRAEDDEGAARTINSAAVEVFASACTAVGARLVHYSTDYVFDGQKEGAYSEDDRPNPLGAYARSKVAGEVAIRAAGVPHVIVRTSWVFSSRGRNFLRTMLKLAAERDELRVVDDQIGAPTAARFIADATAAVLWKSGADRTLAARIDSGETLNICSAGTTSWFGFADYVITHAPLARRPRLTAIPSSAYPTKARRPHNSALSLVRLRDVWGIAPPPWQAAVDLSLRELGSTGP